MDLSDIDVFILCGGLGTRLRSITGRSPKSLVRIGKQPFLDILIDYLYRLGFRRFILGVGYKAGLIKRHYSHWMRSDIQILFSEEKTPLGTGGAVKNARQMLINSDFLVLNGDSFSEFDPVRLLRFHQKKGALATILVRRIADQSDYGNIRLDRDSRLLGFSEKKVQKGETHINAGIYFFRKDIFRHMPRKKKFSLEKDLFPQLVADGSVFGLKTKGCFLDIGTPERYSQARLKFSRANCFMSASDASMFSEPAGNLVFSENNHRKMSS
jgi:D-glycero-alpha-D-manno-heptose 1-phosphate guanylyltransferase